jgi:HAD superfamily hydrolase (TIGR01509 family)
MTDGIKGVIFDIDGVLLDSMEIWTDLGARYLMSLGKEPEKRLAQLLFSMSMEQGAEYLTEHYSLGISPEEVMDGLSGMLRDFYFYEVGAKPGAAALMEHFRGEKIRMTAATSSPAEHVAKALERNGLLGYLDRIFTVAEVGKSKHSPEIFDAAAAFMGTSRDETLVFEDSLYALKTAAEAGFHTAGVFDARGEADQEGMKETAEIYIKDLSEMLI